MKTALLSRKENKQTNKTNKNNPKLWQQKHKLESTHQQTDQQQNNNNKNKKNPKKHNKTKQNKNKIKSNHPTINCDARTFDSGLLPCTCVTGA